MLEVTPLANTSNTVRFVLLKNDGTAYTGLTGSTSGLIISTIADNEASATAYTQAATHIQTIATLGTYAAPSASQCRFGEVDSTNHPGLYEFQFADARFAVSSAKKLFICVSGAASMGVNHAVVQLSDAVRGLGSPTALPNAAAGAANGLPLSVDSSGRVDVLNINGTSQTARDLGASVLLSSGTGAGQLNITSGVVQADAAKINGVATTSVTTISDHIGTVGASTAQTGDSFALIGTAGVGLTNLGDTRIAHLNADVSSRMATYTQPTGFLAATFPSGTIANTTNITAGTITTVTTTTTATNLTNLPSIPANWLTATGIAAAALNGKGDWFLATSDFNATMKTSLNAATPTVTTKYFQDGNTNVVAPVTLFANFAPLVYVEGWDTDNGVDFTSQMKTSLNASTPASVQGDVGGKVLGGGVSVITGIGAQADVEQINGQSVTAAGTVAFPTGGTIAQAGDAMTADLTQAVPHSNTADTIGDCLHGARVQAFGKWVFDPIGLTLKVYESDDTTVFKTFTVDSATSPTTRY